MNIQKYYQLAANTAIHGSLAALFFLGIIITPLLVLVPRKEMVIFAIPFFVVSIVYYQQYLLNRRHFRAAKQDKIWEQMGGIFEIEQALLEFLPAPSLRMLFFHPNGALAGEIRDLHFKRIRWILPKWLDKIIFRRYGLYDGNKSLLATFTWRGKGAVEVRDGSGHSWQVSQTILNSKIWSRSVNSNPIHVKSEALYMDIHFENEEKATIARVRKGWMPIEWEKNFRNANTPVLSLDKNLSKEDRLFIMAILIHLFRYREH